MQYKTEDLHFIESTSKNALYQKPAALVIFKLELFFMEDHIP